MDERKPLPTNLQEVRPTMEVVVVSLDATERSLPDLNIKGATVTFRSLDTDTFVFSQEIEAGATELLVLKNRHGATGYVDLYFYKKWVRFEDMVE